jgi:hypothetical protein
LHATQAPSQATLQQTPSAQEPDAHWERSRQAAPSGSRTQDAPSQQIPRPGTQTPPLHSLWQVQASPGDFFTLGAVLHDSLAAASAPSASGPLTPGFGASTVQPAARKAPASSVPACAIVIAGLLRIIMADLRGEARFS